MGVLRIENSHFVAENRYSTDKKKYVLDFQMYLALITVIFLFK